MMAFPENVFFPDNNTITNETTEIAIGYGMNRMYDLLEYLKKLCTLS
ncbi:MAG: hypothetical protein AWU58_1328 [Methanohalophilus sp. T328-1]|jgi:hypothetical protein|nr:MAG: hypothetical protein AWU58_1328 [Methanohalophilus sp. T328-1]